MLVDRDLVTNDYADSLVQLDGALVQVADCTGKVRRQIAKLLATHRRGKMLVGIKVGQPSEIIQELHEISRLLDLHAARARRRGAKYFYYVGDWSRDDIAVSFGVSPQRISQLLQESNGTEEIPRVEGERQPVPVSQEAPAA